MTELLNDRMGKSGCGVDQSLIFIYNTNNYTDDRLRDRQRSIDRLIGRECTET